MIRMSIETIVDTDSKIVDLDNILKIYLEKSPNIEIITVVSSDGLPIASTSDEKDLVIAAMTAASQSLSERVLGELERGEMQEIILTGEIGYVIIRNAGENGVLSITANNSKSYGLIRVLAKQLAKKLAEIL